MPSSTVQARPNARPLDHDLAADVAARMLDNSERVRTDLATGRIGWLSQFLADAGLLRQVTAGGWDHDDLTEIAGRLWMVAR